MFYILITGIVMAILSAIFWCLEAMPFFNKIKSLTPPKLKRAINYKTDRFFMAGVINDTTLSIHVLGDSLIYLTGVISAVLSLWALALDILCTVWLTGSFGFSGMIGGVIGLTVSNVISVFLIFVQKKSKK